MYKSKPIPRTAWLVCKCPKIFQKFEVKSIFTKGNSPKLSLSVILAVINRMSTNNLEKRRNFENFCWKRIFIYSFCQYSAAPKDYKYICDVTFELFHFENNQSYRKFRNNCLFDINRPTIMPRSNNLICDSVKNNLSHSVKNINFMENCMRIFVFIYQTEEKKSRKRHQMSNLNETNLNA